MNKLLIVDDEARIRQVVHDYGKMSGWEVIQAVDGVDAVEKARNENPDVVVLDIMMPNLDGFGACRAIRGFSRVPIIMLSALGEEYNMLHSFELGVDDYIEKPFSPKLLFARANAIVTRSRENPIAADAPVLTFGGLVADMAARTVTIDGDRAEMTPKEMDLFFYLIRNQNTALSREQIMRDVWGYAFAIDDRTVDTHVKMLRHSLGSYRDLIVTVRATGYKFEAPT